MTLKKTHDGRKMGIKISWCTSAAVLCVVWETWRTLFSIQSTTENIKSIRSQILAESSYEHVAATAKERVARCPDDQLFTWLEDVHRSSTPMMESNTKKIPNILYQTAKGRCVHTDVYDATTRTWLDSTEYSLGYQFYDDPRMDEYLFNDTHWKSIFPGLSLALQCIEHAQLPVMKTDIWRYLILWEQGGIFADMDVGLDSNQSLLHHLREYDDDAVFILAQDRPSSPRVLSQWLMAVCPHHPLMYYAAERAISLVMKARRAIPIQHTGPRALHDATDRFLISLGTKVSRRLEGGKVYTEAMDPEIYSGYNFSFRVTPPSWAKNLAFPEEKKRIYALMNMTHYRDNQKGKKHYTDGGSCLEFLGGSLQGDGNAFTYSGATYSFHNPMPTRKRPH